MKSVILNWKHRRKTITNQQPYNKNIVEVIRLTRQMIILADQGDIHRQDGSCGVLYGVLRDAAYKLRKLAEDEKSIHIKNGIWDENSKEQL
jgi:hypothetical protein